MSLEELWQLFPIYLTEHQSCWKEWYKEEEYLLHSILPADQIARISHIGSTAVEIEHPAIAKEYEKLKLDLWKQYEHNRDGYTQAKTEFISSYTDLAKQKYEDRYH
jgi:GrpB-like predicted nucleotidyltransferase (UPF0157 family)